jgi:hypothetical protein
MTGNNCQPTNDPDRERGTSERGGLLPNKVPEHMSDTRFQIRDRGLGGGDQRRGEIVCERFLKQN